MTSTEYKEQLSAALRKIGGMLPLGFEYTRLTGQNAPLGGVDYLGQTATRAMYADLLEWQRKNKPESFVTEARWQELYASQNGNVPFFSEGDGSTTFRFPRVVGYFKGAGSTDELGQYVKEGLPGHTHTRGSMDITGSFLCSVVAGHAQYVTGAFGAISGSGAGAATGTTQNYGFSFNASRSWTGETSQPTNSIYNNSSHVTPETITVVMGVIAFGSVASIGEATEEGIVTELGELGARFSNYLPLTGGKMRGNLAPSSLYANTPSGAVSFGVGTAWNDSPSLSLYGSNFDDSNAGNFVLRAGNQTYELFGKVNGELKWGGKNIVRTVNGVAADAAGNVSVASHSAPNLAAGVGISGSTTYTVPNNGFVIAHVCSSNTATMTLKINGAALGLSQDDTGHDQICIPVKKGDTVYWSITSGNMNWTKTVTFYPAR